MDYPQFDKICERVTREAFLDLVRYRSNLVDPHGATCVMNLTIIPVTIIAMLPLHPAHQGYYDRTSHPVITYEIDVFPENDPYVVDAEKVVQSFAIGTTKDATLLDSIPWCVRNTPSVATNIRPDENSTEEDLGVTRAVTGRCIWVVSIHFRNVRTKTGFLMTKHSGDSNKTTFLAVPHKVMKRDVYEGYYILASLTIVLNLSHENPSSDRNHVIFGACFSARQCPSRFFARASMWSDIVGILAAFDIAPTEDSPLKEEYSSGVVSYPKPFRYYTQPLLEAAALLFREET
ncbi:hypothetical protein BJY52DRAFT_1222967 [Lactarius psammicola]|nr:hypothetical protein BJY52DRAFT_1222967 [Lactarius psammicola]